MAERNGLTQLMAHEPAAADTISFIPQLRLRLHASGSSHWACSAEWHISPAAADTITHSTASGRTTAREWQLALGSLSCTAPEPAAATTGGSRAHSNGPQAVMQQPRTTTAPQAGLLQPQRSVAAAATSGHGNPDPMTKRGQRCGTHRTGCDAAAHVSQSHQPQRAAFRPQASGTRRDGNSGDRHHRPGADDAPGGTVVPTSVPLA